VFADTKIVFFLLVVYSALRCE